MSVAGGPNIVDLGLVLEIDAGNRKSYPGSGTTWFDKSGNNYDGTLINGPTFNSTNGGTISFDGADDYINCGSPSISLSGGLSYEIWVKLNANNRQQGFFGINNFPTFITNFWMNTDNKMRLEIGVNDISSPSVYGTTQLNTTQWYHVAGTIQNGGNFILYINGVIENQTSFLKTLTSTSGLIIVGSYNNSAFFSNSLISNTKIYNRALTSQEVLQNYNALRSRFDL